ncbi:O-antigen ligase family protein [Clostridium sp. CX1]|uniref:O-antigen ligase family protein n=1 Tax=Clostridium sp. CX1 TaxID=2978346 RepID=UPI0021BE13D4|nr:O-antigen ligase family protein [Clostridium sp. CX1]MCT8977254.1 O-antigen ligase family protein [Clostridium sp. CX1]
MSGDTLLFLIFLLYFVILLFLRERRIKFFRSLRDFFTDYLNLFMVGLFVVMTVSVAYSTEKGLAISETFRFATYLLLFFIIKYEFNKSAYIKGFINSYIVCITIMSIFGIYQYFTGAYLSKGFVNTDGFLGRPRVTVSLDNSNNFGAFLILAIFPVVMLLIYEKSIKKKVFLGILSLSLLINIVFSYSRNAMMGLVIGLIILALVYSWRLLIPIGGVTALLFLIPQIGGRLLEIGKGSENYTRLKLWKTAWYMIKEHPIFGVGNGNFVSLYDSYVEKYPELYIYYEYKRFPTHNSYLKVQSELGVMGIVFFIGILISALLKIKNLIQFTEDKLYKYFYTGFFASMVSFFFMNLSDNLFFVPKTTAFFWLLLAMAEGIILSEKGRG